MTKQSFRKGQLVNIPAGAESLRYITQEEIDAWNMSPASKGMNDAGETKLPPKVRNARLDKSKTFIVTKARAVIESWGHVYRNRIEVVDTETGEVLTFRREVASPLAP